MKQTVVFSRVADRHNDLHSREFADTVEITVNIDESKDLKDVLNSALNHDNFHISKYVITINWPYE